MMSSSNYRYYHPACKPSLWAILLAALLFGAGVLGLLFFSVFGAWTLLHDRDCGLFWLLMICVLVSGLMTLFGRGCFDMWRHRKQIDECFIAFTDTAFVYQDYDYVQGEIVRKDIPLSALRRFEFIITPSGPDVPDTWEVHVHYEDAAGQPQRLELGYFDYQTTDSLPDTLTREWQSLKGRSPF